MKTRDGKRPDLLACAYAEVERYEAAAQLAVRAISLATEANKLDLVKVMSARLELFRQARPYRTR